jgi:hypothetical protein
MMIEYSTRFLKGGPTRTAETYIAFSGRIIFQLKY